MRTPLSILAAVPFLLGAPAAAQNLWADGYTDAFGNTTYNNGQYTQLDQYDINSSPWGSTVRDNYTGTLYDCDIIGICSQR